MIEAAKNNALGVTLDFFKDAECAMPSPFHPSRNLHNEYLESSDESGDFFAASKPSKRLNFA